MKNVHVISHPLVEHKLAILRDEKTESFHFRSLVDEISYLLLFEATRDLPLREVSVKTPITITKAKKLSQGVMICPILRAALGMLDSVFKLIPDASVGFLGFKRDEETLKAEFYYEKLPSDHARRTAIIIDPMLATGGTAIDAVNFLKSKGVVSIKFLTIIATPVGLKRFTNIHPDVHIFTACIDEGLNNKGYIVPGLGDAGDRVFNTTMKTV